MNLINNTIYDGFEPLPEDTTGWQGDSPLFETLIRETKPTTIIEVGTWKGQSAINMGKTVKNLGLNTTIHCVDTWLGAIEFWTSLKDTNERNLVQHHGYPQIYYQFLSNVIHNGLQDVILPFPNTSENGFRYFATNRVTSKLIYIDASHEEDDVYRDVCNYYQLLEKDGIMFGDDYYHWTGVRLAVDKFVKENNIKLDVIDNNFWLIRK